MELYEYKHVKVPSGKDVATILNELSKEWWRVVYVAPYEDQVGSSIHGSRVVDGGHEFLMERHANIQPSQVGPGPRL